MPSSLENLCTGSNTGLITGLLPSATIQPVSTADNQDGRRGRLPPTTPDLRCELA